MTRKAHTFYFAIGIVAGLLLTACAGVAAGKIDLPGPNNTTFFFSPVVNVAPVPEITIKLDVAKPLATVDVVKDDWSMDHVKVNTPAEVKELEPLTIQSAVTTQVQSQTQVQEQTQTGHFCNRGQ